MNALTLSHKFIGEHVKPGQLVIDATAGKGKDTLMLCKLVGDSGKVIAMDIQEAAITQTKELLVTEGWDHVAELHLDSHSNMSKYAEPGSVDCIVFNFGWLPGGDHNVFTHKETNIEAIEQGLTLLKSGGIMSLTVYYGRNNGYEERDAILDYLTTIDDTKYTVMVLNFTNRKNDPPFPVFIIKD